MTQNVIPLCLLRNILQKNACSLYQLNINISIIQFENPNKMFHHAFFTEKIEVGFFVLLRPNNILSHISYNFNQKMLVRRIYVHYIFQTFYQ